MFLFILGGLVIPLGLFLCFLFTYLSQVFLQTCTICSVTVFLAKLRPWRKLCCCCECQRNCPTAEVIYQGIFISRTFIVFVGAFGVFILLPTTNKSLTPENSRDQKEECAFLGFFDWHDLLHFLSPFGVLMTTTVIMFFKFWTRTKVVGFKICNASECDEKIPCNREVFNCMSKLIWDCFCLLYPIRCKTKINCLLALRDLPRYW